MSWKWKSIVGASALVLSFRAMATITLYEGEGFRGRSVSSNGQMRDLSNYRNRTGSVVVDGHAWEVCDEPNFQGRCVILRTGSYDSRESMGVDRILSARTARRQAHYENEVPPPMTTPSYEWRQRPNERLYEADVTSVHAVVGPPEQRCWVERQRVEEPYHHHEGANVGGAVAGAIIGGVLGHQIGHGHDAAAAGGAIAGAAIGANVHGHHGGDVYARDVQHCATVPSGPPEYWEVTYNFRGVEHTVQMTDPPDSSTIPVNRDGEPRI